MARTFKEFRDEGLLWAINKTVFHARGFAIAFNFDDEGNVNGWDLVGDGSEVYTFDGETDDSGFERFQKFIEKGKGNG